MTDDTREPPPAPDVKSTDAAPGQYPWWRQPIPTTVIVAIVAAITPATTAVQTWLTRSTELELKELESSHQRTLELQKQEHEIQHRYLLLALEKREDESKRLPVLRFLSQLQSEPILSTWAKAELMLVEEEIRSLRGELQTAEDEVSAVHAARFRAASAACDQVCSPKREACMKECKADKGTNCSRSCMREIEPCLAQCHAKFTK
jgi:hypothetical protein